MGTQARRDIHRAQLRAFLPAAATRVFGPATTSTHALVISQRLGIGRATVRSWFRGEAVPRVHTLPALAALLDVPLPTLAEICGTPAEQLNRLRFASDPDNSMPMLLRTWQEAAGLDTAQAAAACGISRWEWGRFVNGSRRPGRGQIAKLAAGTGIALEVLLDADRITSGIPDAKNAQMTAKFRKEAAPLPSAFRAAAGRKRLSNAAIAEASGLSEPVVDRALSGEEHTLATDLKLALTLGVATTRVMTEHGFTAAQARATQAAIRLAKTATVPSAAQQLHAGREHRYGALSKIARQLGYAHPAPLHRLETGENTLTLPVAMKIAPGYRVGLVKLLASTQEVSALAR